MEDFLSSLDDFASDKPTEPFGTVVPTPESIIQTVPHVEPAQLQLSSRPACRPRAEPVARQRSQTAAEAKRARNRMAQRRHREKLRRTQSYHNPKTTKSLSTSAASNEDPLELDWVETLPTHRSDVGIHSLPFHEAPTKGRSSRSLPAVTLTEDILQPLANLSPSVPSSTGGDNMKMLLSPISAGVLPPVNDFFSPPGPEQPVYGHAINIDDILNAEYKEGRDEQSSKWNSGERPFGLSLEDRISHVLHAAAEVGFENFDTLAEQYYTAPFRKGSLPYYAQSTSRNHRVDGFLAALDVSRRSWIGWEVAGPREKRHSIAGGPGTYNFAHSVAAALKKSDGEGSGAAETSRKRARLVTDTIALLLQDDGS